MTMAEISEDDTDGVKSSKVIVKESSQVNSASRIYNYGGASVPFFWETRPGTPKHSLFSKSFRLPPLTPPPSFYSSSSSSSGNKQSKTKTKQYRFVKTLFNGKHHVSRPSFSWSSTMSSSSSSSSFSSSSPFKTEHRARKYYLSCSRSYVKDDDEEQTNGSSSPTSTLCYKKGLNISSSMGSMKRTLCSLLSHGSSRKDLRLI